MTYFLSVNLFDKGSAILVFGVEKNTCIILTHWHALQFVVFLLTKQVLYFKVKLHHVVYSYYKTELESIYKSLIKTTISSQIH